MPISPVTPVVPSVKKNSKPMPVRTTGYIAVGAGAASYIAAKSKNIKLHTKLAYLSGLFTLVHLGLVEYLHFKYKK